MRRSSMLLILLPLAALPAARTEQTPARVPDGAVLVTLAPFAAPDGTAFTGSVGVRDGRIAGAEAILTTPKDKLDGERWTLASQHYAPGLAAPKVDPRGLRGKGFLFAYEAPPGAEVTVAMNGEEARFVPSRLPVGEARALAGGAVSVQVVPPVVPLTGGEGEEEYPSLARAADGRLWAAWQSWDGKADRLWMRACDGREWAPAIEVSERPGDYYRPTLGSDGEGRLWVVWAQNDGGNWDLYGRFRRGETLSPVVRLTDHPGGDDHQVLAVDTNGRLWIAWQANRDGNWDIYLARLEEDGLRGVQSVTRSPASDREPALCALPGGRMAVAWDTYRHGSYDVYLREVSNGRLSPERPIAFSGDYEAHAALASDGAGRVWIAWDNGGPAWGQHDRKNLRIHTSRRVEVRCLSDGRLYAAAADPVAGLPAPMQTQCELPQLAADAERRVWLFFRHNTILNQLPPDGPRLTQSRGIWNVWAMALTDQGWSAPLLLAGSSGRNDQRMATCAGPGGLWLAYAGDARERRRAEVPLDHNAFAARLPALDGGVPVLAAKPEPAPGKLPAGPKARSTVAWKAGGAAYQLLLGDTHRHTDISRCGMNQDGSLFDTYRYAQDVAQLDFLAISDHDQDILKHRYDREARPRQEYAWWRSQKYADLCHLPGRFIAVYGYEHGGSYAQRGGHKNVLYVERGQPCVELDSPAELFAALPSGRSVAIPHQLADGSSAADWSKWDGRFETVAELFQARGNYEYAGAPRPPKVLREGNYYWDAVGAGRRIGIIASSDHGLVHGAYAGVYVTEPTRRGVVDGLRDRRTFGSTDDVRLEFCVGDAFMGAETECVGTPRLEAQIRAPKPIARVDVIRDGRFLYTQQPGKKEYSLHFADTSLEAGQSGYYYVRAILEGEELAWTSPIWVKRAR